MPVSRPPTRLPGLEAAYLILSIFFNTILFAALAFGVSFYFSSKDDEFITFLVLSYSLDFTYIESFL